MDKHPADVLITSLLDGQLDNSRVVELRDHLGKCSLCRLRIGQSELDEETRTAIPKGVPNPVLPASEVLENRETPPRPGEVWRLVWEEVNELGVIDKLDEENQRVIVMPVLSDIDLADEWCGLTSIRVVDRELDVAASVALATSIPWCVLDARVGQVEQLDELRRLRGEFKHGGTPAKSRIARGLPLLSQFDRRAETMGELGDAFHNLAEANWGADIPNVVTNHVPPSFDLLVSLGIPVQRALAITRGEGTPSTEELVIIGKETDVSSWTTPSIPDSLRLELNLPRWRPALRQRARENHTLEADERVTIALEARQPIAARGTHGGPVQWRTLLERLLV